MTRRVECGGGWYMWSCTCSMGTNGAAEGHVLASDPVEGNGLPVPCPVLLAAVCK